MFGAPAHQDGKTPAELYEDYIKVIGDVSAANGLQQIWNNFEPSLQQQVEEWKNVCNSDASPELRYVAILIMNA